MSHIRLSVFVKMDENNASIYTIYKVVALVNYNVWFRKTLCEGITTNENTKQTTALAINSVAQGHTIDYFHFVVENIHFQHTIYILKKIINISGRFKLFKLFDCYISRKQQNH